MVQARTGRSRICAAASAALVAARWSGCPVILPSSNNQKRIHISRRVHDVLGQLLDRLFIEPSIRVAEDNRSFYSQNSRCQVHLSSADRTEVAEHRPKGRSLSHGKAEQGEVRALSSKRCQHRAETKGLIIGMGRYG